MIFFIRTPDTALDHFKHFECLLKTQLGQRIKVVHVDNAKEFAEGQYKAYLDLRGIILCTMAPYSLPQNGVVECLNCTLAKHTRMMLLAHNSPKFLWQEAFAYTCFLKNWSSTRALRGVTPYKLFWGKHPDLQDAQEFGIPCWVLIPANQHNGKLDAKSEKYIFTGIGEYSADWHYYTQWQPITF